MSDNMKARLRNWGLWTSVAAFLPILAVSLGTYDINMVLPGNYDKLILAVLGIMNLLGLINNPTTSSSGFRDDKTND